MALHSRSQGSKFKRSDRSTLPTAKPDNRQWETNIGNGFVRVDNGAPPARLPSESQPVSLGNLHSLTYPSKGEVVKLSVPTELAPIATPVNHNTQPPDWRRDFGLGK